MAATVVCHFGIIFGLFNEKMQNLPLSSVIFVEKSPEMMLKMTGDVPAPSGAGAGVQDRQANPRLPGQHRAGQRRVPIFDQMLEDPFKI